MRQPEAGVWEPVWESDWRALIDRLPKDSPLWCSTGEEAAGREGAEWRTTVLLLVAEE